MDDFGNDYQTMEWFTSCTQYIYSMSVHGLMDEMAIESCLLAGITSDFDYAQAEI